MARTPLACMLVAAVAGRARADTPIVVHAGIAASRSHVPERGGGSFVTEIKGMVADNLAIGGRVEIAMMFGGHLEQDVDLDFALVACGLVDGELSLTPGAIRPFIGLGIGPCTVGSQTVRNRDDTARIESDTGNYLGIAPQIGIDIGRVRIAATYTAILGARLELRDVATGRVIDDVSQNLASLELSFRFGSPTRPTPSR